MTNVVNVIGGGLAGVEASWQAAERGAKVGYTKCSLCSRRLLVDLIRGFNSFDRGEDSANACHTRDLARQF